MNLYHPAVCLMLMVLPMPTYVYFVSCELALGIAMAETEVQAAMVTLVRTMKIKRRRGLVSLQLVTIQLLSEKASDAKTMMVCMCIA